MLRPGRAEHSLLKSSQSLIKPVFVLVSVADPLAHIALLLNQLGLEARVGIALRRLAFTVLALGGSDYAAIAKTEPFTGKVRRCCK